MRTIKGRRGAAAVEFAVVAPVFFLFVFAMLEFGRAVMVQQVLVNGVREGARYAVVLNQSQLTETNIRNKVLAYLEAGSIPSASVQVQAKGVSPGSVEKSLSGVVYGDRIRVTAEVPWYQVTWLPVPQFLKDVTLHATSLMRYETVQ